MDGDSPPAHCSSCGESLAASMNFCPNCGATTRGGSASRTDDDREIPDREVLEYRIRVALNEGWDLEHDFGDHAVLIRRSFGGAFAHVLVALLTFSWTMGVGNVLYAAYSYFGNPTRAVVDADGDVADGRTGPTTAESILSTVTALVLWTGAAIFAGFGLLFASTVGSVASGLLLAFALLFVVAGLTTFPPTKCRLEKRGPVTRHGRIREVDERPVVDPDAACADCGGAIDRGLERTHRDEVALFGVPLTASEGTNAYCRHCVRVGRRFSDAAVDERGSDHGREVDLERA